MRLFLNIKTIRQKLPNILEVIPTEPFVHANGSDLQITSISINGVEVSEDGSNWKTLEYGEALVTKGAWIRGTIENGIKVSSDDSNVHIDGDIGELYIQSNSIVDLSRITKTISSQDNPQIYSQTMKKSPTLIWQEGSNMNQLFAGNPNLQQLDMRYLPEEAFTTKWEYMFAGVNNIVTVLISSNLSREARAAFQSLAESQGCEIIYKEYEVDE